MRTPVLRGLVRSAPIQITRKISGISCGYVGQIGKFARKKDDKYLIVLSCGHPVEIDRDSFCLISLQKYQSIFQNREKNSVR